MRRRGREDGEYEELQMDGNEEEKTVREKEVTRKMGKIDPGIMPWGAEYKRKGIGNHTESIINVERNERYGFSLDFA